MSTVDPGAEGARAIGQAMSRHPLARLFFFVAFLFLLWQTLRILSPFYVALLGAAVLAFLAHPAHQALLRRLQSRRNLAAGMATAAVAVLVLVPVFLLGRVSARETAGLYPRIQERVRLARGLGSAAAVKEQLPDRAVAVWEKIDPVLDAWNIDWRGIVLNGLEDLSKEAAVLAGLLVRNALLMAFDAIVLLFALFFFLRDGPRVLHHLVELAPMHPEHKQAILGRLEATLYAVVRGALIVAALQGGLSGLGYVLFGVPFPVLLGLITTLLSPIPIVGAMAVWSLVAAGLALTGAYDKALMVAGWNIVLVFIVDNFVRPMLISSRANLPLMLLFFGMLGGLKVYGASGILLGPVVIALVLTFVNIYRREYATLLKPPTQ